MQGSDDGLAVQGYGVHLSGSFRVRGEIGECRNGECLAQELCLVKEWDLSDLHCNVTVKLGPGKVPHKQLWRNACLSGVHVGCTATIRWLGAHYDARAS